MKTYSFIPLSQYEEYPPDEMQRRTKAFYEDIKRRRTVRDYSDKPVDRSIIENCILAAGTAANGANLQPWHFAVVSNQDIKKQIRDEAEKEEREFYEQRAPQEWLDALAPLGTTASKPFLETAPYLIVIFAESHKVGKDGKKQKNYYVQESVGIATGVLMTALHCAGLVSLTHTPSPMNFLNKILNRPSNERPYLILVVGHPAQNTKVPDISKKPLNEIATFIE